MKRLQILGLLVVFFAGCNMNMDHFLVYDVQEKKVEQESVLLKGQFDDQEKKVIMLSARYFANPVAKSHEGAEQGKIYDERRYFTWYKIKQPELEPRRTVRFKNQFGMHSVDIRTPLFLLVPAQKNNHEFPEGLDHYKAYEIIHVNTGPALPTVVLKDQFGTHSGPVGGAVLFCVPVSKQRGKEHIKIKNDKDHFAVYKMATGDFRGRARISDQFLQADLQIGATRLLAVPTEKLVFKTHDD